MRKVLLLLSLCILPGMALTSENDQNWTKVKDKNGIQIYRAHTDNSRLKTFRAVTRIELENIQSFVGLLLDEEAIVEWMHFASFAQIKETDKPEVFDLRVGVRLPWPIKNRGLHAVYEISQNEDYSIRFNLSNHQDHEGFASNYIVCPQVMGFFELKPFPDSKEVEITAEFFVDPGGYIPPILVNIITDDMSYYSTKKLTRLMQKEKYLKYETPLVKRRPWVTGENN